MRLKEIFPFSKISYNGMITEVGTVFFYTDSKNMNYVEENKFLLIKNDTVTFFGNPKNRNIVDFYLSNKCFPILLENLEKVLNKIQSQEEYQIKYLNTTIHDSKNLNKILFNEKLTPRELDQKKLIILKEIFEKNIQLRPESITKEYGGWILPEGNVIFVTRFNHDNFIKLFYNHEKKLYAYRDGFIRFVSMDYPEEFSVESTKESLKKNFKIWLPAVFGAQKVYIDIHDIDINLNYFTVKLENTLFLEPKTIYRILNDPENYKKILQRN